MWQLIKKLKLIKKLNETYVEMHGVIYYSSPLILDYLEYVYCLMFILRTSIFNFVLSHQTLTTGPEVKERW